MPPNSVGDKWLSHCIDSGPLEKWAVAAATGDVLRRMLYDFAGLGRKRSAIGKPLSAADISLRQVAPNVHGDKTHCSEVTVMLYWGQLVDDVIVARISF